MSRDLKRVRDLRKSSSSGNVPISGDGCVDEEALKDALSASTDSSGCKTVRVVDKKKRLRDSRK